MSTDSNELRIGDKFVLQRKKLGRGSFGTIYLGRELESGETVAIKLEPHKTRHPQLISEARLLRTLQHGVGIPRMLWNGVEGNYNVMALTLLGQNLESLFTICGRVFTLKTVLMLADQMLERVQFMHSRKVIHRDIKPDNFLMGSKRGRENQVYIIDFGLSKHYCDTRTGAHIPYRENKSLTGTARYASVNTHRGIEQSRRDDLESLGYIFMYFCRGSLPWQGLKANTKEAKYKAISDTKAETTVEVLCNGYPVEFANYLNYVRSLNFTDTPDYGYLRKQFRSLFIREGYVFDYQFDWVVKEQQRAAAKANESIVPTPSNPVAQLPTPEAERSPAQPSSNVAERSSSRSKGRSSSDKRTQSPAKSSGRKPSRFNRKEKTTKPHEKKSGDKT